MDMKQNTLLKRFFAVAIIMMSSVTAWAGASSYYTKMRAVSGNSGMGLVYASSTDEDPQVTDYTTPMTADPLSDSGTTHTWYGWAKPARGYIFSTWTAGSGTSTANVPTVWTDAKTSFLIVNINEGSSNTKTGNITATFESDTPINITYAQPNNGGIYTIAYSNVVSNGTSFNDYSQTYTMTTSSANRTETSYSTDVITLTATGRVSGFQGWYNGETLLATSTAYTFSPTEAITISGRWNTPQTGINITFKAPEQDDNGNPKGTYTVGGDQTVSTADVILSTGDTYYMQKYLVASPAEGYVFAGWYTLENGKKNYLSYETPYYGYFDTEEDIYANFIYTNYSDDQKAQFKVGSTYYTDLNEANTAAHNGSDKTIICTHDGILPPGTYTISSDVTLYIPYSASETPLTTPEVAQTEEPLEAYRTLYFKEGTNILCDGIISVGGKIFSAYYAGITGYVTGPCGLIDMSEGGHIEFRDGSTFYCWGFVKGQDVDQGNNTIDAGTIDARAGSIIWENFASGDWRGGSALRTMVMTDNTRFFPFQTYFVQNIEIPLTIHFGATEWCYTNVSVQRTPTAASFPLIGSNNTLFKLTNSSSLVRKWYDPTTDLMCYELSGTAELDALQISLYGFSVNSSSYDLPINSNMHLILTNCNMKLKKPVVLLPGSILEIKSDAKLTIESNVYLYDQDNWDQYLVTDKYFCYYGDTYGNFTTHKDRGLITSKAQLNDAQIIVDGEVVVATGGRIYSTAGGADIMGNGGGTFTFPATLPSYTTISAYLGEWYDASGNKLRDLFEDELIVESANLHNEDGSYSKSVASSTYYNLNGRWFREGARYEKSDGSHTYDFSYISSGSVSGTSGTSSTVRALYSADKTGLTAGMKWCNVVADGSCSNIYNAIQDLNGVPQSTIHYIYQSDAWLQLINTETANLYSGSDNQLYTLESCVLTSVGAVDEDCFYEVGGVKKALINGSFISLAQNSDDGAWHNAANAEEYYLCFEGCNWHAATKYVGQEKAYTVNSTQTYIWYNNDWLAVEREEPYFFDLDAQNVKQYYEYINDEWTIAQPVVRVADAYATRNFYSFEDAMSIATAKRDATITILRDITGVDEYIRFSIQNTTYTLDLNGHTISGTVNKMLQIAGEGTTFTITDSSEGQSGAIQLSFDTESERWHAALVEAGTLVLNAGTISNTTTASGANATGVCVLKGAHFVMNGGAVSASSNTSAHAIRIQGDEINTTSATINGGTVTATTSTGNDAQGIFIYGGQATLTGTGIINATAAADNARGIYSERSSTNGIYGVITVSGGTINANAARYANSIRSRGTTTITGGQLNATATTTSAYGILVQDGTTTVGGSVAVVASAPNTAGGIYAHSQEPDAETGLEYHPVVTVNGGTFSATANDTKTAYGVYATTSYRIISGTTYTSNSTVTINGGAFTVNAATTDAFGVYLSRAVITENDPYTYLSPTATITGGTFNVSSATKTAAGVRSFGTTTITGGSFTVRSGQEVWGVQASDGLTTIGSLGNDATPSFDVKATTYSTAAGVMCGPYNKPSSDGKLSNGETIINGGNFTIEITGGGSVYGVYVYGGAANNFAHAGTATINGGEFAVQTPENKGSAYGIVVNATQSSGSASATPTCTVNDGKFLINKKASTKKATGSAATTSAFQIYGGYWGGNDGTTELNKYAVSPKQCCILTSADPEYADGYCYHVAEKFTITFMNGETQLQSDGQREGTTPLYSGDTPTKASTEEYSYTFDGWSLTDGGAVLDPLPSVTAAATYYAHFNQTVNPVASVTVSGETTNFTDFATAFEFAKNQTAATTITILRNISGITSTLDFTPATAHDCTLDLNNYTVSGAVNSTLLTISNSGATFTITDSSAEGNGVIDNEYSLANGYIYNTIVEAGTLNVEAGTIRCNNSYTSGNKAKSAAVKMAAGQLNLSGGTIHAEARYQPIGVVVDGSISMTGGTIEATTPYAQAKGLQVRSGGSASISGGTISATPNTSAARAIQITGGTTTITGGTITAETNSPAYTIDISGGTLTISNATVSANATASNGIAYALTESGGTTTLQSGYYKATGTTAEAVNYSAGTLSIEGGYYSQDNNLADHLAANRMVSSLTSGTEYDEGYRYEVATAYTITFMNGETQLQSGLVKAGLTPVYSGVAPTKDATAQYTYTFDGWSLTDGGDKLESLPAVSANATYYAHFSQTTNTYTITWKSDDGTSTLETDADQTYGASTTFDGSTDKAADENYIYTFDGWATEANGAKVYDNGSTPTVSADATYYAHYTTAPSAVSVSVEGGGTTYYTNLAGAFTFVNAQTDSTTITILQDISGITSQLEYKPSTAHGCALDLNNHTVSGAVNSTLFKISGSNTYFTITDNSGGDEGKLSNIISISNVMAHTVSIIYGTLNIKGGTVYCENDLYKAETVIVNNSGSLNIIGGVVEGNSKTNASGILSYRTTRISGGEVKAYTSDGYTKTVNISGSSAQLIMTGGSVTGTTDKVQARAVIVASNGTANITGGEITASTTLRIVHAIQVSSGSLEISNAVVSAEATSHTADAVYLTSDEASATIHSGKYSATGSSNYVDVNVEGGGTLSIEGGYYTQNTNLDTYLAEGKGVFALNSGTEYEEGYRYEVAKAYTVTFMNGETQLQTGLVKAGTLPVYSGAEPTKDATAQYTYTFDGWSLTDGGAVLDPLPAVSADATYYAHFSSTENKYTITWKSDDGTSTLETDADQTYGASTTFDGSTPTKATDEHYFYAFDGWATEANGAKVYDNGSTPTVSADVTYYAHYATSSAVSVEVEGGSTTYFTDITDAFTFVNAQTDSTTITILQDISGINATLTYNTTAHGCALDLNNHTVTGAVAGKMLDIDNLNVVFTIMDNSTDGNGVLRNLKDGSNDIFTIYVTRGTLNIESGKIYAENNGTKRAIAVRVNSGPKRLFNMNGGTVEAKSPSNPSAILGTGKIVISGGTVKATATTSSSKPILISGSGGDLTMSGGTIIGQADSEARSICVEGGAAATITGGTISATASGENSYGVLVSNGSATISNATVSASGTSAAYAVNGSGSSASATILSGKYKATATSDVADVNAAYGGSLTISGGYYSQNTNLDTYVTSSYQVAALTAAEKATIGSDYNYKVVAESGFYLNIVDVDNTNSKLVINANGWASSGWPYTINGISYEKDARQADRTLKIPYTGTPGDNFVIDVQNNSGETLSIRGYSIPKEITSATNISTLDANQVLFVKNATLTANATKTMKNIYIADDAQLVINSGVTLTVDTLFLRTTPYAAAQLTNDGTISGQVCYTRIIMSKSQYYQFGLPVSCALTSVRLSDGSTPIYQGAWLLRSYSESSRAANGATGDNWVTLAAGGTIAGGVGYEMFSASNYYREYYFPVALKDLQEAVSVSYTAGAAGAAHCGWNIVTSPLTGIFNNTPDDPATGLKVSWLQPGDWYKQEMPEAIPAAIPFSYQASSGQTQLSFAGSAIVASAPRRESVEEARTETEWLRLDVNDAKEQGDQTSLFVHPSRFADTYEAGIDVAKQSFSASRALVYSTQAYGEMAFAGISDSQLEEGVALTLYSPAEQELTFSLRENNWLNRMAYVWITDMETGAVIDLLSSDYSFTAPQGTTRGRFILSGRFNAPQIATGTEELEGTTYRIYNVEGAIAISGVENGTPVYVFDAVGHVLYSGTSDGAEIRIPAPTAGVYMLHIGGQTAKMVINK